MTDAAADEIPLTPAEIWARIRAALCEAGAAAVSPGSDIPALAGLFDTLTIVERNFAAAEMIAALTECFASGERLGNLQFAILALVEPYLNLSNYQSEARLQCLPRKEVG